MQSSYGDRSIAVIIASAGRPEELGRWRDHVARQTVQPVATIWAVSGDADLPPPGDGAAAASAPHVVHAPAGSAPQRNAALDALDALAIRPDIVAFFDDDYVPGSDCLEGVLAAFDALPDAIGLTGTLLADGACGRGISWEAARDMIQAHDRRARPQGSTITAERWEGLYGCNMALRGEAIGRERFDERLPLYGWQEDVDFALRVARGRLLARTNAFLGVHQGVKRSRTSGRRFGYSQIANPAYLYGKGVISRGKLVDLAARNFLSNHGRMLRPEPWVDRRGRALGNWLALLDILRGRITPERILEL